MMVAKDKKKVEKPTSEEKNFRQELISQLLTLSTSAFGLVAALAWNEAIQNLVHNYIDRFFPITSGVIYRFGYALLITILGVTITFQLSRLAAKFVQKRS